MLASQGCFERVLQSSDRRLARRWKGLHGVLTLERKLQPENGAPLRIGRCIDHAAVRLDDPLRDGETKAGARPFGRDKRLEQPAADCAVDPRAGVYDADFYVISEFRR